ncbi:hypothetical protein [Rhodanobacter sp. FW106-PBR-LB-2-11]|uniref:hypothetical protein n=1 Tax=Rhodanobacter sp. FW106-PBR-LB-2-11 TaxID=1524463 RepID=UPI0034E48CDF
MVEPNNLIQMARDLYQECERLATDVSAGAAAMESVTVRARELGCCWMRAAPGERPAQNEVIALFGIWFDLEIAFLAGATDVVNHHANERRMEELDYETTGDVVAQIKDGLLAVVPELAGWCDRHQRTEHLLGDWLYLCAVGDALIEAVTFVASEDADIARDENGPFELRLPTRALVITNESLFGAISEARERISQNTAEHPGRAHHRCGQ